MNPTRYRLIVWSVVIVALWLWSSAPAGAAGSSTEFTLSGLVNQPGTYNLATLQALPSTTETATYTAGGTPVTDTYTGVYLYSLLTAPNSGGGVITNPAVKNQILQDYVLATGSDGYTAVISLGEISPNFGHQPDLVAYRDTGGQLTPTPGPDGFARLVVPGDTAGGRYVSNLVSLQVLPAVSNQGGIGGGLSTQFTLTGVQHPGTFTLSSLQGLPSTTLTTSYQGPAGLTTDTYTGVSLWTLLNNQGLILNPNIKNDVLDQYVVVTGTDGYKSIIALGEIAPNFGNRPYLIAYSDTGGQLGLNGSDGFARLVVPGDIAGGRFVSNISSLEVVDATVPEPATLALFLSGLGGLAMRKLTA